MIRRQSLILICTLVPTAAFAAAQTAVPAAAPTPSAPRRAASPAGTAATQVGSAWIEIVYSRPILRGRTDIFGKGADYGKKVNAGAPVWRAGANQTTRFMTEVPLAFGGKTLPAGEYSVFVDLEPNAWTLIFSKQPYQQKYDEKEKVATWGSDNYNQAQ